MTKKKKNSGRPLASVWPKWINKYTIVILLFLVWIVFFDKYNVSNQMSIRKSVQKLENELEKSESDIVQAKADKENLENNIEKYAREKFKLHKTNEDVFVIDK